ncbi:CheR family methyltransferase [Herbidospora cretacea]|uniref:CheR family methyltransferase n=1 Tax=Herbidospora cretacea TaxID=28444 RepID=UPI0004C37F2F|nr:protein-glutamate O-methyltransferase CheR [Herbidospora cretacea]
MIPADERDFDDLLAMLKETRGFDFTGYKRTTLMRRIARRLESLKLRDYSEYRDYLELEPEEFNRLFDSLLINVTGFFRDPVAWQVLRERVVPAIVAGKQAGKSIRVWSAGCATGEEAYSLAMILAEEIGVDEFKDRVKIYATDLDEQALQVARSATYTDRQMAEVPPELREAYFESSEGLHAFRRDLRRQVIFGRNDLTRDAPISRIDLLLARNTLMYFNTETQLNIVRRFHFALANPGYLFLGKAEMLLNHGDKFEPLDLRMRLFRKTGTVSSGARPALSSALPSPTTVGELQSSALASGPVAQLDLDTHGRLALVNSRAEMLFGLNPRDIGRPFQDLEVSYRPVELRSVIEQAQTELRTVELQEIVWRRPGQPDVGVYDVSVVPLQNGDGDLVGVGVNFYDVTRYRRLRDDLEQANRELENAYEELHSLNEELETTNEELQSLNEELETTNEELQSTNEELETMNEELQSTNDELQQINFALNARSVELDKANAFVSAMVRSLGDAVAVVDTELRVLVWSPGAEELWGVRADEATGRQLTGLDISLPLDILATHLRAVIGDADPRDWPDGLAVDAVNRRGRTTRLSIEFSRMLAEDGQTAGVILLMDVLDPVES